MKPNIVAKDEKKIIGIKARTSNSAEANPQTTKIPALWQKFFQFEEKIQTERTPTLYLGHIPIMKAIITENIRSLYLQKWAT